jgi:exonuclease SbcD
MVLGGDLGGGERTAHTIFDYCVPTTAFPATAHYVALGHLHRAQQLPGPAPIWYCGSPLHLDFGETKGTKSVNIIEAAAGKPAIVRPVALREGRRLQTIRGTLNELRPLIGTTGDDYLRVFVHEPARAGLADDVRELFPEAVDVIIDALSVGDLRPRVRRAGRSPHELFVEYLTESNAHDERVVTLFDELLDQAHAPDPA